MKVHSSKLLKVCFVLAAFVFFLAALLMPVKSFAASAGGTDPGSNGGSGDPDPGVPDPEPQLPIYYFSDSEWGEELKSEIEGAVNGTEGEADRPVHYTPFNPGITVEQQTQVLGDLIANAIPTIEESYVIFEFETPFALYSSNGQATPPDKLYSLFSTLKANDCFVMFICGTDEYLFRKNNAFLDYVDIHVNTDKLTTFFTSIMYQIKQNYDEGKIEDCVFFLDRGVAPFYELGNRYCNFVSFHLFRSIKLAYMEEIRYGTDYLVEDVLKEKSIRVLCHESGDVYDTYYDIVNGERISISMDDDLFNNTVYAIGTNENGEEYSQDWITEIRQICEEKEKNFTVFYYEYEEYGFGENWYQPSTRGTLYTAHGAGASYLLTIMADFVSGQDMHPYDNWTGRCNITHKVRIINGSGWLVNLLDLLNLDDDTVAYLDDRSFDWRG